MKTFFEANYDDVLKTLDKLGIDVRDNKRNYRLFGDIINDLAKIWDTVEDEDKTLLKKHFHKE